jgi:hypothetical protein
MGRVCTICSHDSRYDIDCFLVDRSMSYRDLAGRYGLSKTAIGRHVSEGHISELIALAADAERAAAGESLLDRIEALQTHTLGILEATEETNEHRTALAAIREARRNLELIGEVTKELNRAPTLNLSLHPQYIEARTLIVQALEHYPQAKEAVVRALESGGNGRS